MNRGTEALAAGLGPQLAGEKITINGRIVTVIKQLGEGAQLVLNSFAYCIFPQFLFSLLQYFVRKTFVLLFIYAAHPISQL